MNDKANSKENSVESDHEFNNDKHQDCNLPTDPDEI